MINATGHEQLKLSAQERTADSKILFGFWVYLMTDFVLFASLFAAFAVLRGNVFGGVGGADIFHLPFILIETLLLLSSSFTCGIFLLFARAGNIRDVLFWLYVTALLGAAFVGMELYEFNALIAEGHGPDQSGFLSSFFTLVGTHGLHVTLGLVWMILLTISVLRRGLTRSNMRKLMLLAMFWHFLDVVWIFIFTIVYLMGAV